MDHKLLKKSQKQVSSQYYVFKQSKISIAQYKAFLEFSYWTIKKLKEDLFEKHVHWC